MDNLIKEIKVAILGHTLCKNYKQTKSQLFQFFKRLVLEYDEVEIIFDRYVQIEKKGAIHSNAFGTDSHLKTL